MPLTPLSNFSLLKNEALQAVTLGGHLFCANKHCDFTFHFGTNLFHQLPAWGPSHVLCAVLQGGPDSRGS